MHGFPLQDIIRKPCNLTVCLKSDCLRAERLNKLGQDRIFCMDKKVLFSHGTQWVIPGGQDGIILPAWIANHSGRFGLL